MSEISQDTTLERVAAAVCSAPERHGVQVVLSGGSVVTIYSDNEYQSYGRCDGRAFAERATPDGVLRLLRPTECVMDRLAGFYHWNDPQCLDQAVAVASRHVVDMPAIEAWSRRERAADRFAEFFGRLQEARARRAKG